MKNKNKGERKITKKHTNIYTPQKKNQKIIMKGKLSNKKKKINNNNNKSKSKSKKKSLRKSRFSSHRIKKKNLLKKVPEEIIMEIFLYVENIYRVRRTCKLFANILNNEIFWENFCKVVFDDEKKLKEYYNVVEEWKYIYDYHFSKAKTQLFLIIKRKQYSFKGSFSDCLKVWHSGKYYYSLKDNEVADKNRKGTGKFPIESFERLLYCVPSSEDEELIEVEKRSFFDSGADSSYFTENHYCEIEGKLYNKIPEIAKKEIKNELYIHYN